MSDSWTGRYLDPQHPGCKREIQVTGKGLIVYGADGNPGCLKGGLLTRWELEKKYSPGSDALLIDFSPKGGPKDVPAKYIAEGDFGALLFPDGNKWIRAGVFM
eukprot:TRINITY_DN4952_c0_g1_i3.p2 TRINITY_DN4952_c0_g1~~TRINITY_DN4952_c0_g1_i3.p2  ORF type:complete len:103 (+),score=18.93 TRINITY_DN4952_c0_g1_i3:335-643(+)